MTCGSFELHNIAELIDGPSEAILPENARVHIRSSNADGTLGPWAGIEANGRWICRIPDTVRRTLNGAAQMNAIQATGAEVRFTLPPEGEARIVLNSVQSPSIAEVWHGSFFAGWSIVGLENTEIAVTLPANLEELRQAATELAAAWDPTLVRVRLPWRPPCRIVSIEGDMALPSPELAPSRICLAYGSSITHGNTSVRTSAMYASRVAQRLDTDLINLGFGGGAHLEEEIATYIAEQTDFDFATFELGINLIARIEPDEFERRVDRFVDIVVEAHGAKPLYFIDLFPCKYDYGTAEMRNRVGIFRRIVREKVTAVQSKHVLHLDGRELLSGPDGLTADLVHPSPAGMETIASRLAAIIGPTVSVR